MNKEQLQEKWNEWQKKSDVVGYVQMSNCPAKLFLPESATIDSWETLHKDNNFIWEANLHSKSDNVSIAIKQIGSEWFVHEVSSNIDNEEPNVESVTHSYIANNNEHRLKFKEIWQEEDDEWCCNMKVLKPLYSILVDVCKN